MRNRISGLALRHKVAAMILVPLSALVIIGVSDIRHYFHLYQLDRLFIEMVDLSRSGSGLMHAIQRERGMSAGFLKSGGTQFSSELRAQRTATGEQLSLFREAARSIDRDSFNSAVVTAVDEVLKLSTDLNSLRSQVDSQSIKAGQLVPSYTAMSNALLDIADELTSNAPEGALATAGAAYSNKLHVKELADLERALLAGAFATDSISATDLERLSALINAQEVYAEVSLDSAIDEQKAVYKQLMGDASIAVVDRMRLVVLRNATDGGFNTNAGDWFDASTKRIGVLTEISLSAAEYLREVAVAATVTSRLHLKLVIGFVLGTVVLSLWISVTLSRNIVGSIGKAVQMAEQIAAGDLTATDYGKTHHDETGKLLESLERTRTHLVSIIGTAQDVAKTVQNNSHEIHKGHASLGSRTEEQAVSVKETSTGMEEISETTRNNAASAERADRLASQARTQASTGQDVVSDAVNAMEQINEASRKIENIIGVIDEIAFQTNLLALNAAVEAARAGEQGRGFAVVASEVRQLAGRSAEAAKEIKELIHDSVSKVESGAGFVNRSGDTLEQLVTVISEVSELISGIAGASREQAIGVERIHESLTVIDGIARQNVTLVEEASSASQRMDEGAHLLTQKLGNFKVKETCHGYSEAA